MIRVGAIILARANQGRWPDKVLYPIAGKPMLEWVLIKTKKVGYDDVIVTTTTNSEDQIIVEIAKRQGVKVSYGLANNRNARCLKAIDENGFEAIALVSACVPFFDIDLAVLVLKGCREYPKHTVWWSGVHSGMEIGGTIYQAFKFINPAIRKLDPEKVVDYWRDDGKDWRAYKRLDPEIRNKYLINLNIAYPFQGVIANMVCNQLDHFPVNYAEVVRAYMEIKTVPLHQIVKWG